MCRDTLITIITVEINTSLDYNIEYFMEKYDSTPFVFDPCCWETHSPNQFIIFLCTLDSNQCKAFYLCILSHSICIVLPIKI